MDKNVLMMVLFILVGIAQIVLIVIADRNNRVFAERLGEILKEGLKEEV